MNEHTVINDFLGLIDKQISQGFGLLENEVLWLFNTLVVLNILLAGLHMAVNGNEIIVPFFRRLMLIGFFAFLITNWNPLTQTIADSFVELGIEAGGRSITKAQMMDPGTVAFQGFRTVDPLLEAIEAMSGPVDTFVNLADIAIIGICSLFTIVAFFVIAIQMFLAIVRFKLGALVAFVLIPFAVFNKTAFIAERPLSWVVASGVRLMVISVIVTITLNMYSNIQITTADDVTLRTAGGVALGAALLMVLAWQGPALAQELMTGVPSLSAQDDMRSAVPAVAGTAGVAMGAFSGARGAASMVGGGKGPTAGSAAMAAGVGVAALGAKAIGGAVRLGQSAAQVGMSESGSAHPPAVVSREPIPHCFATQPKPLNHHRQRQVNKHVV